MTRLWSFTLITLLLAGHALSQEPGTKVPSVTMAPVSRARVAPGAAARVELDFRIGSEFHINSNKPKSELLIPTALKLSATNPLTVVELKYPAGEDTSFPFSPDEKLSVYSGDFTITAVVRAQAKASAGIYPVTGELRFQACDRSACYPPRSIPVKFEVTVAR